MASSSSPSPSFGAVVPAKEKPTICTNRHKAGHTSSQCPDRPTGNNKPPDPCWSCGEYHRAHECAIAKQRTAAGVCILCGDEKHWLRACPLYDPAVHVRKNNKGAGPASGSGSKTTYVTPRRTRTPWCLRCGVEDHSTCDCSSKNPPVLFPDEPLPDKFKDVCLFCGFKGHSIKECMRRAPAATDANASAIASLQTAMAGVKKSLENVTELKYSVEDLQGKMSLLITWQQQEANPAIERAKKNSRATRGSATPGTN